MPPQHRLWRRIGFLQLDTPVFQLFERDRHIGHRAAHKRARPHDAEVPVEIFHLRFPRHLRGSAKAVEHVQSPFRGAAALFGWSGAATLNITVQPAALNPTIGASMRHLTGLILWMAVAFASAARADAPKPEPVEIAQDGLKLK